MLTEQLNKCFIIEHFLVCCDSILRSWPNVLIDTGSGCSMKYRGTSGVQHLRVSHFESKSIAMYWMTPCVQHHYDPATLCPLISNWLESVFEDLWGFMGRSISSQLNFSEVHFSCFSARFTVTPSFQNNHMSTRCWYIYMHACCLHCESMFETRVYVEY